MFCKNCGKELPDTAKFCSGCGTPVAPAEPQAALVSEPEVQEPAVSAEDTAPVEEQTSAAPAAEEPAAAETPVRQEPEVPAAPAANVSAGGGDIPAPVKRRGTSGMVVIGGIAVVALIVIVLAVKLIGGMLGGGGSSRTQAFAYLTEDSELMYLADLKEKTEAIEVSDKDDPGAPRFTKDGKTLYYTDRDNTLYKIAVSELKKGGRPERVARDVEMYSLLDNGGVLYSKYDLQSGTYEVTCVTGKEDFRLIKECGSYQLDEGQNNVYYTEYDSGDNVYTLYKIALKKDAEEEELLDGYRTLYTDWDASLLVYSEDDSNPEDSWSEDADHNTLTVYSCKPGGEAAELIDDVYDVYGVTVDGGKVSFYYTTQEVEKYSFYDLVSDSKAGEDEATLAQELVSPNWYDNFYPSTVLFEEGSWYYTTYSGEKFSVDSAALTATYGSAGDGLADYQVRNIANNAAQTRYNAALEEYKGERELYNQAQSRSYIRESLKSNETSQSSLSLYRYTGDSSGDPIATGIDQGQWNYAAEEGVFLYKKAAGISGGKLCDVADMTSFGDIYNYMGTSSTDDDWYQNVGGTESVIDFDEDVTSLNSLIVLNGKEVVIDLGFLTGPTDNRRNERIVNAYTLDKTGLTFAATIAEDRFSSPLLSDDEKSLYFFTEVEDKDRGSLGDLTRYSGGGKTEVVAKEVYGAVILDDSGTIYLVTDISSRGERELSLLQGDKTTVVTDELTGSMLFLDGKQILYIADGDLCLWDGKENRRVAKDVSAVFANVREGYSSYSPNW